jgi:hypothetical protein
MEFNWLDLLDLEVGDVIKYSDKTNRDSEEHKIIKKDVYHDRIYIWIDDEGCYRLNLNGENYFCQGFPYFEIVSLKED